MPYLKNCWYAAAWSEAVAPGQPVARTLLDTPPHGLQFDATGQCVHNPHRGGVIRSGIPALGLKKPT